MQRHADFRTRSPVRGGRLTGALLLLLVFLLFAGSSPATEEARIDLTELSLEELLALEVRDVRGGEAGSYAFRLAERTADSSAVQVHGYMTSELTVPHGDRGGVASFDLHHAVVAFRSEVGSRIFPEISLEYEHAGTEFYLSFAFVDVRFRPELIARVGYFVAPVGAFNEYQYPDFLRRTGTAPMLGREVVPGLWSEVGFQLRGRLPLGEAAAFNYALFASNGLEQPDDDPDDDVAPEGGSLRGMRRNAEDANDSDKALGGRLGVSFTGGVDAGISGYTGAYTVDGERRLSIVDADFAVQRSRWVVRLEAATALQEISGGRLTKSAAYAMAAFRASREWEPYLLVEASDLDAGPESRRGGILGGLAYYLAPESLRSACVKTEWKVERDKAGDTNGLVMLQLTLSF